MVRELRITRFPSTSGASYDSFEIVLDREGKIAPVISSCDIFLSFEQETINIIIKINIERVVSFIIFLFLILKDIQYRFVEDLVMYLYNLRKHRIFLKKPFLSTGEELNVVKLTKINSHNLINENSIELCCFCN